MNSVAAALAQHARTRPDHLAVRAADGELGYGALYARASVVAAGLRDRGVLPGDRVGIHGDKSIAAVVGLLGVLLAGAAYVPLDPSAPAGRRRLLAEDAGCKLVLAPSERAAELAPLVVASIASVAVSDAQWCPPVAGPDDVAYVLYTSGSTGLPKGVRIPHRALAAFFDAVHPIMDVGPGSVCLNTSALHFDVSVVDLLYPLVRGATVHLGPSVPFPGVLLGLIETERITHLAAVGSTLTLLAQYGAGLGTRDLTSVRRIMTGAEVLNPATVQSWLAAAPHATVVNGYGPTEATCLVVALPISEQEPGRTAHYPIGRPLPGVTVAFLADDGGIGPDGPGEILVAGSQVMLGYLNRPDEEKAAFLDHDGVRYYRTGDLGQRASDGVMHFAGRRDDEVKIRGYRINLNEVRRAVETHPDVARAFVGTVPDEREGLALACALLPKGADAAECALAELPDGLAVAVADHVAAALPRYMVPRFFHGLTGFPTLSTGKPDTARLRALLAGPAEQAHPAEGASSLVEARG
jgi:amino acid adenylation domain-containing protein